VRWRDEFSILLTVFVCCAVAVIVGAAVIGTLHWMML